MAETDDERRLLAWIGENGGPPGTVNVIARSGETGFEPEELGRLVEGLARRSLVEVLDDGDVHLTAFGRATIDGSDL
jgi:hypothetical protein